MTYANGDVYEGEWLDGVRCGQGVPVCPAEARILSATEGYPDLPEDYVDCNRYFAKDRVARGQLVDFTGGELAAAPAPEA